MNRIRVAVRGAAGLLGSRFMAAAVASRDIEVVAGIVKNDPTFQRLVERYHFGGPLAKQALPNAIYVDEEMSMMERMRETSRLPVSIRPIGDLVLKDTCEAVVDAAVGNGHGLQKQYHTFPGPIILQDGEYPTGRLIAPPLVAPPQGGNRYRQGGCFLSGIAPVLSAFESDLKTVRLHLVMQFDGREADFMVHERVNTFRIVDEVRPRVEDELNVLLPEVKSQLEAVVQVPSMLHYAVTVRMELSGSFSTAVIKERLRGRPRVRILPESMGGTYELNLARAIDDRIPPILVFGGSVEAEVNHGTTTVRMVLALYYRTLAVLPNLDSLRILCRGLPAEEAMRITDRDAGLMG